ncbi:DMT family transporter [Comamonas odontotermitis]|uniref:DMT family transporter n=1 Tax=Comamonas odontotermitis TaxID=379895 RepID=UPI00375249C9
MSAQPPSSVSPLPSPSRLTVLAFAIPFTLVWASAFAATKFALLDSSPLLFLAMRFFCAGALLLAWSHYRGERIRPNGRELASLLLIAACNHALYLGVSWSAMREVSAGLATIVIGAAPIVVALLAVPLLRERLTGRKLAGLLLGFAGMAFIVRHRLGGPLDSWHGTLMLLLALVLISLGTVLYKRLRIGVGSTANIALQLLLASAIMLPWALSVEQWSDVHLNLRFAASMLWSVAVVSIAGYTLWFALLRRTDASSASAWFFLTPPLGLIVGWAVLGEPLALADFLGIVPVVIGIVLVTLAPRAARPIAPSPPARLSTQRACSADNR